MGVLVHSLVVSGSMAASIADAVFKSGLTKTSPGWQSVLLAVDDRNTQGLELDPLLYEGVGADDQVDLPGGDVVGKVLTTDVRGVVADRR